MIVSLKKFSVAKGDGSNLNDECLLQKNKCDSNKYVCRGRLIDRLFARYFVCFIFGIMDIKCEIPEGLSTATIVSGACTFTCTTDGGSSVTVEDQSQIARSKI